MKKFKSLCLILIVFGLNIMNSQDINYKNLLGIEHSSLVGDSIKLEKNTFIAFEKVTGRLECWSAETVGTRCDREEWLLSAGDPTLLQKEILRTKTKMTL